VIIFAEPLAAAIQTFELTPVNKGDTVAVLGVGRLGTLVCAVANILRVHDAVPLIRRLRCLNPEEFPCKNGFKGSN